jgi:3-isopropylmalate dehydratase small subunit
MYDDRRRCSRWPVLFRRRGKRLDRCPNSVPFEEAGPLSSGWVWVIDKNNIDTDMIFHNRYLTVTDVAQMGQYTFDNLAGWTDFAKKAAPGDIVVTGSNFGAGSSRQQAVDCFRSLGIAAIIARSFGAIYERNAINAGLPVLTGDLIAAGLRSGEQITVDFGSGKVTRHKTGEIFLVEPFSEVQMAIYLKGGLLSSGKPARRVWLFGPDQTAQREILSPRRGKLAGQDFA